MNHDVISAQCGKLMEPPRSVDLLELLTRCGSANVPPDIGDLSQRLRVDRDGDQPVL